MAISAPRVNLRSCPASLTLDDNYDWSGPWQITCSVNFVKSDEFGEGPASLVQQFSKTVGPLGSSVFWGFELQYQGLAARDLLGPVVTPGPPVPVVSPWVARTSSTKLQFT
jgi:hypothetical protein